MIQLSESKKASSKRQRCAASHSSSASGRRTSLHLHLHLHLLRIAIICTLVLSTRVVTVTAFVPQSSRGTTTTTILPTTTSTSTTTSTTTSTSLSAKIPAIDEWEVLKSGAIKGTISNHPTLPDGYEVTTSPLDEKAILKDNALVKTASGSKYKLLQALPSKQQQQRPTLAMFGGGNNSAKEDPPSKLKQKLKQQASKAKTPAKVKAKPVAAAKPKTKPKSKSKPSINYDLNGKVVGSGNDDYLLVGKLIRSSSKRSQIYYAYKADKDGNPSGPKLTIKLTASKERLSRENKNYDRVFSKGRVAFSLQGSNSCFVKKVGFCPEADASSSTTGVPKGSSVLVLEAGDKNLRAFLTEYKTGLTGKALRKASVSVCRCVEAMHSSGLVWTDLKAENFVLVNNNSEVKGIDLESAVPVKSTPEDYSPEACPPEFAVAEKKGVGYEFQCIKNYDSWSLGILLYELSVGKNYFAGKSEDAILALLATGAVIDPENPETIVGLDAIPDNNFRDLVKSCLSINPNKRPSIGQILLHPYFLMTGLGPLTF
jgi:hypothetical protein